MDARTYREELLKMLLSHASDSFKETTRVTALIEDKAQKTAALAGVFLAAGLSFIKPENLSSNSPLGNTFTIFSLTSAIIGLIITVLICLWILWVREQATPIKPSLMKELVSQISKLSDNDLTSEVQDRSKIEITNAWIVILDKQEATNRNKADGLKLAQSLLTLSIVLVAFALLVVLVGTLVFRLLSDFKG